MRFRLLYSWERPLSLLYLSHFWLTNVGYGSPPATCFYPSYQPHSEKSIATHSSSLAWKIPWTEEPGELWSMGSHRVRHNWSDLVAAAAATAAANLIVVPTLYLCLWKPFSASLNVILIDSLLRTLVIILMYLWEKVRWGSSYSWPHPITTLIFAQWRHPCNHSPEQETEYPSASQRIPSVPIMSLHPRIENI